MFREFGIVWGIGSFIGKPLTIIGECSTCKSKVNNYEKHFIERGTDSRMCLFCMSALRKTYEEVFRSMGTTLLREITSSAQKEEDTK